MRIDSREEIKIKSDDEDEDEDDGDDGDASNRSIRTRRTFRTHVPSTKESIAQKAYFLAMHSGVRLVV